MTPCSLIETYWCAWETFCHYLGGKRIWRWRLYVPPKYQ